MQIGTSMHLSCKLKWAWDVRCPKLPTSEKADNQMQPESLKFIRKNMCMLITKGDEDSTPCASENVECRCQVCSLVAAALGGRTWSTGEAG
jgi:hypothetical protein